MQRNVLGKRHSKVEAQTQVRVALRKAVDLLFRFAAALGKQDLRRLDDRGVKRGEAVERIDGANGLHNTVHLHLLLRQQLHEAG